MATNLSRADFALVTHLQATWHRAPREGVDPYLAVDAERQSFPLVMEFDPTEGRYYLWLSVWRRHLWNMRGFRVPVDLYELDEVRRGLERFEAIRHLLPPERRDIGQYKTVEDLGAAVPTRLAENYRRREAEALKQEAYRQSDVLFQEGRWMIVRLNGFVAARFWGLGTKWCTTSSEATYMQYAAAGHLLVLLTPFGRYQLATGSGMLRDERDHHVALSVFRGAPAGYSSLLRSTHGR